MTRNARTRLKALVGFALSRAMPRRTERILREFTLPYWGRSSEGGGADRLAGRMIRFYLAQRDTRDTAGSGLEELHKRFWKDQVDVEWYESRARVFETESLVHLEPLVERFRALLGDAEIHTVCEIGTGDGRFLAHLRDRLPGPTRFLGLDLSADRMARNRALYPGLEFVAADAAEWIEREGAPGTLYVTNGGVFEYFNRPSLEALLSRIAARGPSAVALFWEPLAPGHDIEGDRDSSLTLAGEFSFSHSYPHLLGKAGLVVCHQEESNAVGYRGISLLARSPSP